MLLSALLVALVLVAVLAAAGWSFGSFTLVTGVAVALVTIPVEGWRFLPAGLAVGLAVDLALWWTRPALRARVTGGVAAGVLVLAFGAIALATSNLGWSPTLLLGVATAAAVIGWGIGAIGSLGERRERPA